MRAAAVILVGILVAAVVAHSRSSARTSRAPTPAATPAPAPAPTPEPLSPLAARRDALDPRKAGAAVLEALKMPRDEQAELAEQAMPGLLESLVTTTDPRELSDTVRSIAGLGDAALPALFALLERTDVAPSPDCGERAYFPGCGRRSKYGSYFGYDITRVSDRAGMAVEHITGERFGFGSIIRGDRDLPAEEVRRARAVERAQRWLETRPPVSPLG